MGQAIGYVLRKRDPLTQHLDDGRLDIDNNRVERQMRAVAVGRKNWMFAGPDAGARRAATIYSLVCTCGLLGVEPWAYLKDVLQRIAEGEDPAQRRPRLWKAARATTTDLAASSTTQWVERALTECSGGIHTPVTPPGHPIHASTRQPSTRCMSCPQHRSGCRPLGLRT
ncbi:MAG: transposase [Planctomycetes bacterium]|nr:transposase [Planctomycetota bacterium]